MSVYLHDIPLPEAQSRFQEALAAAGMQGLLGVEEIPLDEHALGRVLAEPIWARLSSPHYHASAMDGFAVRAADTEGALPSEPRLLEMGPQAVYLDTGDPLPAWADAVIPIENVEPLDATGRLTGEARRPAHIRIRSAVTPWSHVRSLGEDIVATQLVLPKGHTLRPVDLGAAAASGHISLHVARRPRVAIIPTGTELVPIGQPVKSGDIIEFNSVVLASQVNAWGGEAVRYPIVPDNFDQILETVRLAAEDSDLVLLNAGSSAGSEDFSARVVQSLGDLLVHGVAVRPGHPVILGMVRTKAEEGGIEQTKPIIGVPGYPVSAALTGEIFIEPLISLWLGRPAGHPQTVQATLTRKVTSPAGDDDYMRVALGKVNDRVLAAPLSRGAGVITSLVRADGIAILPRGLQGMSAGDQLIVRLYRSPDEIEQTIFAVGSHDIILDLMAQYLAERERRLSSANVGSLGGLVALKRGEAHLAGSHLFDPATAEYNLSYIRQYLPGIRVKVITLAGRQQGLLVLPGNPKGITGLKDLVRPDVRFVNRQRGAGTRVLLDYQLDLMAIVPDQVRGYNQEEYTHLAVAAAVSSGKADTGLGIAAAATALNLDFIELFQERYDLVIPVQHFNDPLLKPLLDLLSEAPFRQAVAAMPGYDIKEMGNLVAEI
ncbi:MAG TPA: molybdopterin biosynthesis protein [Anaerolineales bacterium]